VVEAERDRPGGDLPPWRRLHARRERAVGDAVPVLADLLDRVAVEVDVRFLPAHRVLLRLGGDGGEPARVEEGAQAGLGIELGPVGRDLGVALAERHVAGQHHPVGVGPDLRLVGEEGQISTPALDRPGQRDVVLVDLDGGPLLAGLEPGVGRGRRAGLGRRGRLAGVGVRDRRQEQPGEQHNEADRRLRGRKTHARATVAD
jgi:hypothetical protein